MFPVARTRLPLSPKEQGLPAADPRKAGHGFEVVEVHGVADVLPRSVAERLEIPGVDLALVERRGDQPAPALALAHFPVQFGQVPAPPDLGAEAGDKLSALGFAREIVALAPVALEVIELVGIGRAE